MTIYTAEQDSGDLFIVAAWDGLNRLSFRAFVLENLSSNGIPEPDRNIQHLDLCEWGEADFFQWNSKDSEPIPTATWKEAKYCTLYWTYPGVWSETPVTKMPAELAGAFWDGDGVERSDPKHPEWHSTHADLWDLRDKGA